MGTESRRIAIAAVTLVGFIISLFLVRGAIDVSELPKSISDPFTFSEWVNSAEDWLKKNYRWFTRMIAGASRR